MADKPYVRMGTATHPALLAAILDDPLDDTRRAVYADYLSEQGDPRGELIALELAPGKTAHRTRKLNPLRHQFEHDLWKPFGFSGASYELQRGFIHEVRALASELANAARLFETEPVWSLVVLRTAAHLAGVLALPLQRLRCLETHDNLSVSDVTALARASSLERLERLALNDANLAVQGAQILGTARVRPRHVALRRADLTDEGFVTLVTSGVLDEVEVLDVSDCELTSTAVIALAGAPWSAKLRRLDVSHNRLDDEAVIAICKSRYLTNLEYLSLEAPFLAGGYAFTARAAAAIEASENFGALKRVDVADQFSPELYAQLGERLGYARITARRQPR